MSLLPQGPLVMPGLSVTALCVPAREVGGDYYDFLPLDDHRVGMLIADVSGKGTSAALYMAELKGLMLSLSRIHTSPRELLIARQPHHRRAPRRAQLHHDDLRGRRSARAHDDLRARRPHAADLRAGPESRSRPRRADPGARRPGARAEARRRRDVRAPAGGSRRSRSTPATSFVFFTDGISEAMNAADDCFGEARLGRLVEEHAHLPSEELRERVLREIAAFVGDAPQHDDMTMILLKVERRVGAAELRASRLSSRDRSDRTSWLTWSSSSARTPTSRPASCAACSRRTASRRSSRPTCRTRCSR